MDPKMLAVDAAIALDITTQAILKKLKIKKLSSSKSQNRVFFGHESAKSIFEGAINHPPTNQVITFEIVKGGAGKSSIASSVAVRASLYGLRVLCIDLDPQGNLTQAFGYNPSETPIMVDIISEKIPMSEAIASVAPGIMLIPSRIENSMLDNTLMLKRLPLDKVYASLIEPLKSKFDLIIIDCPPSLGQSVSAAALASNLVVAPVSPESFCLSGLRITIEEIRNLEHNYKNKIPLKILLNKFDSRTKLSHEILRQLMNTPEYQEKMFQCYIRASQDFANSAADQCSIYDSLRPSTAKEDIDIFTRELISLKPTRFEEEHIVLATQQTQELQVAE